MTPGRNYVIYTLNSRTKKNKVQRSTESRKIAWGRDAA